MSSSMQPPLVNDPAATGGMGGMEEATDTIGVPPLVDPRTLTQFCQAIQKYADAHGFHDQAQEKILDLQARLAKYQDLARLCRFAVLGLPKAVEQVRDEMECIAVDFPGAEIHCPKCCCSRCCCPGDMPDGAGYKGPAQFAAALDLFAGAAFVTKCDPERRDRFIAGLVRGIEDAISYPLAYAQEAAEYLNGSASQFPFPQIQAVMGTATNRFLEGDVKCDPRLPEMARERLEGLACKWMRWNPVTELFYALTGPRWDGALHTIQPHTANIGDHVTLGLCVSCADKTPIPDPNTSPPNTPPPQNPQTPSGPPRNPNTPQTPAGTVPPTAAGPPSSTLVFPAVVNVRQPAPATMQPTLQPAATVDQSIPPGLKVLFCPRQPAKILSYSGNQLLVEVPAGSRSGPIALVRNFGAVWLGDIIYLLNLYACEYPVEWAYSVFSLIPMYQWAYPVAFGEPHIKIPFIPQKATVSAYSTYGKLGPTDVVSVNDTVTVYYQVDPPGSDQATPVQITASSGTLRNIGIPGAIGFTPSNPGDVSIKLSWGSLTSTIVVHVVRSA
jgi:hypothetical protein